MPLTLLEVGQFGKVAAVLGGSEHGRRLGELGLCPGATVRMVQPGSSCIVCLGDRKLCVRSTELGFVLVDPCDA